jgi:hypothetical protein
MGRDTHPAAVSARSISSLPMQPAPPRNPFRIRRSEKYAYNSFRIRTYGKKEGEGDKLLTRFLRGTSIPAVLRQAPSLGMRVTRVLISRLRIDHAV